MEGIIKFKANKINSDIIKNKEFMLINPYRKICFDKKYIGIGNDGIGYGNISIRSGNNNEFIISASATGGISEMSAEDYSRVTSFSIDKNSLECEGKKLASSESLSHAAIYSSNSDIKAVIHIHNIELWLEHKDKLQTTASNAEYGTVAMANAISSIVIDNKEHGIIIMGGHKEGILAYGNTLNDCITSLDNLFI